MKRLYFLAVATAVVALPDAGKCPELPNGQKKFLPHETDCYKYYECTNTDKQVKDCPNLGTVQWCFDKTQLACVKPNENANCCKPAPAPGPGNGNCTDTTQCKMYYVDDVVEVCVKKTSTGTLPKFF